MAKVKPVRKTEAPTTKRGEERRKALLLAARDVFLERGYAGTSVEDVVARVGGSKASLYSYFGNKDGLFGDLISMLCDDFFADLVIPEQVPETIEPILLSFGRRIQLMLLDPKRIAMLRMVMAESVRFPALAERFYNAGPRRGLSTLAAFFQRADKAGLIHCPRPQFAAIQFMEVIKAHAQFRALMGLAPFDVGVNGDEFVRDAVKRFLYGCTPPPRRAAPLRRVK